jgi:predicted ATP-grasp superfamily ATP-dependent carboligase
VLAVAALSARALVESASLDGTRTVALDCFGDADTQRLAVHWHDVGTAQALHIDDDKLLASLSSLAQPGDVVGWIAGSGFDGRADLLERGAALLPLIGTAPRDVRRVRDTQEFFGVLHSHGIGFPSVSLDPPATPSGWLLKDAGGCGGRQVRRASAESPTGPGQYWQRERRGLPMSATFVANGRDAVLLGFNAQLVRRSGDRPYLFCGVVGPVPVSDAVQREVTAIVRLLAAVFRLRGLGSLDFLLDGDTVEVLELNPRPPASLALYPRVGEGGPVRAHLRACQRDELPPAPAPTHGVRGTEIVFAPQALQVDAGMAAQIAQREGARDLPRAGTRCAAGDPLCSLVAEGRDLHELTTRLAQRRDALLASLETTT